jgi:uncharacterized protein (DUF302 family)/glutaredoxin
MKLYQRERCPSCRKVRDALEQLGISYEAVSVPKLGSERSEVLKLSGIEDPEVPVLVDGEMVLQGSEAIVGHLDERYGPKEASFGDPRYGLTRVIPGMTFSDAVPRVQAALADEGFGVLTEIDVKATMKKKLDVDFTNYVILGACNPPLAHQALSAEPGVGLLLPCNVVVTEDQDGNAVVSAIDPMSLFSVVGRPDIEPVAKQVGERLRRVMASIK